MFYGRAQDDPMQQFYFFKTCCDTVKFDCVPANAIYLTLFQFSLGDYAINWYKSLHPQSIANWDVIVNKFLERYFPSQKT